MVPESQLRPEAGCRSSIACRSSDVSMWQELGSWRSSVARDICWEARFKFAWHGLGRALAKLGQQAVLGFGCGTLAVAHGIAGLV